MILLSIYLIRRRLVSGSSFPRNPLVVIALLVVGILPAGAQNMLRNNPPSVKWRQLTTEGFKVIYPENAEETAGRVANTLEHIRRPLAEGMGKGLPRRIPIVIQNNSSISNGFVTLSPRRSELNTMPPQYHSFIGTSQWLDLVTIHEYRHMAQFNRSRSGLTKWLGYVFGQNTRGVMAFAAVPRWFWEGDATYVETVATHSGRGRMPEWNRVLRASLLEGRRFGYNKQHLGSFKDNIPDHYRLGLFMTAHIRKRTGERHVWDNVTKSAFGKPVVPFTFSNALKKHTGRYLVKNYESMLDDMTGIWQNQLKDMKASPFETVNTQRPEEFTDYAYPQILEDGTVVAFKSGLSHPGQLVRIAANGREGQKRMTGIMIDAGMMSAAQYKVFWNEYEYDPRWRAKTFAVIKSYDFATGQLRRITERSRYIGAGVAPDGYSIATVLNTPANKNHVVVINAISGQEMRRFGQDKEAQYGMPVWSADTDEIAVLKTTEAGKAVLVIDATDGTEEVLIAASRENIGSPFLTGQYLFYTSPYNGIDNIYVLDRQTGRRYQVTQSQYGAYSPVISKDRRFMVYADHGVNGLNVARILLKKERWVPLEQVTDRNVSYPALFAEEEELEDLLETVPDKDYGSKKYSRLAHLLNIHSWGPFTSNNLQTAQVGVFSRDVLSTTRLAMGYTYDINEKSGFVSANLSYQGWYPIIDLQFDTGNRQSDSYRWEETTANVGFRVPLLLTRSRFFRELTLSNTIGIRQVSHFSRKNTAGGREFFDEIDIVDENDVVVDTLTVYLVDARALNDGEALFNGFSVDFSNFLKVAPRNIASRWGQFITLEHYTTLSGDFEGGLFGARGGLFFPSPLDLLMPGSWFENHSLNFRFGHQFRKEVTQPNVYAFRNAVFKPRGFSYPVEQQFTSVITNYALPLVYPDLSLGPLFYLKRIKMNLFFDYGRDQTNTDVFTAEPVGDFRQDDLIRTLANTNTYVSYGAELTFDFNVMRFRTDIEMGARLIYKEATESEDSGVSVEFIFAGINF